MENISAMTVNWLTAQRTLEAVQDIKKYYPDLPTFVVDDGSSEKNKPDFFAAYQNPSYRSEKVYDPETDKIKNIPGTTFIQVPTHRRHGESIDFAMQFIHTKWVFHIDSDVRLVEPRVIEYMMEGMDDSYCGAGIEKQQNPEYPKISNNIMLFRGDLYHQYGLSFKPIYEVGLEAGSRYFKFLTDKGYKIKFLGSGINNYRIHLRYE